jgi:hypothetical protein
VFTAQNRCYSQTYGTSIGNQISPILSSIAVAWVEGTWLQIYKTWWTENKSSMLFTHYVDNRFVLAPTEQITTPAFSVFSHPEFYIKPVVYKQFRKTRC